MVITNFDAFKAKNALRDSTSSCVGVALSLILIALVLGFSIPLIVAYSNGISHQSLLTSQLPMSTNLYIPDTIKVAIVFWDKATKAIANHTYIRTIANINSFLYSIQGNNFKQGVQNCDPTYFSNTINQISLTDCFIFPDKKIIEFTSSTANPVSFGFLTSFLCSNPFSCASGSASHTAATNNFADIFANYTFTLYFTAKVFTQKGQFNQQVFTISSSEWENQYTITSDVSAQLVMCNVTINNNIVPWKDKTHKIFPCYQGVNQGRAVPYSTTYNAPPRASFYSGDYYIQYYIYSEKVDKLLAQIGGTIFLFYIILLIFGQGINSYIFKKKAANDLLIQIFRDGEKVSDKFGKVNIEYYYIFESWFQPLRNCCKWDAMQQLKVELDICNIIMYIKLAQKNVELSNIPIYNKERKLIIKKQKKYQHDQSKAQMNPQSQQIIILDQNSEHQRNGSHEHINSKTNLSQNYQEQIRQKLNLHEKVYKTVENPKNSNLISTNPSAMAICSENQECLNKFNEIMDQLNKNQLPPQPKQNCAWKIVNFISAFIKYFDFFRVKPGFNLQPQNSTCCSCSCTFFWLFIIILLSAMTMKNINQGDFQILKSQLFHDAKDVHYSLNSSTFKPFFCLSNSAAVNTFTSGSPSMNLTFIQTNSSGTFQIPKVQLAASAHTSLGIYPGTVHSTISTQNCFSMQDGYQIQMGGLGTSNEAYFSIKIQPYCSGTQNYCEVTNLANLKTTMQSFVSSYSSILYIPYTTLNTTNHILSTNGYYAQQLRKGTNNFVITDSTLETVYVDQVKLTDRYTTSFNNQPKMVQRSITASRHQQDANVEGVQSIIPYHEIRIRPSGATTDIMLVGHSLIILFAIFGGVGFFLFRLFKLFVQPYNNYQIRLYKASKIYQQQDLYKNSTFLQKIWTIYSLPLSICCGDFRQKVNRMTQIDQKMMKDDNLIEIVKDTNVVKQLSTAHFKKQIEKKASQIYFKENFFIGQITEVQGNQNNPSQNRGGYQQMVEQNPDEQEEQAQILQARKNIDEINLEEQHELITPEKQSCLWSYMKYLDFFKTSPQMAISGQWKVKSTFGGCLSIAFFIIILLMLLDPMNEYSKVRNRTVSHNQYMTSSSQQQPFITLDSSNFGLALGFYIKPNTSFIDVSSYISSSSNLGIKLTQTVLTRSNNVVTQTNTTVIDLTPCPTTYFQAFKDTNTDYSFMSNLQNAFCLNTNQPITLTSSSDTEHKYANIEIYDKTGTSPSTQLTTLLNQFIVGLFMTVPIIDLDTNTFKYSVQQIRGELDIVSRSFTYNLTLSKQELELQLASYVVNPEIEKKSTYNYLTPINPNSYTHASGISGISSYSITLNYRGLVDSYVVKNDHFLEIFGLVGGLIAFWYFICSTIGNSFNYYKMKYIIAKRLYLPWKWKKGGHKRQKKEIDVDYLEIQLFFSWLFRIIPYDSCNFGLPDCFITINAIVDRAWKELDYIEILRRLRNLKDTFNQRYKVGSGKVQATNLFIKLPYIYDKKMEKGSFHVGEEDKKYLKLMNVSDYSKNIMKKLQNQGSEVNHIFKDEKIRNMFTGRGKKKEITNNRYKDVAQVQKKKNPQQKIQDKTTVQNSNQSLENMRKTHTLNILKEEKKKQDEQDVQIVQTNKPKKQQIILPEGDIDEPPSEQNRKEEPPTNPILNNTYANFDMLNITKPNFKQRQKPEEEAQLEHIDF